MWYCVIGEVKIKMVKAERDFEVASDAPLWDAVAIPIQHCDRSVKATHQLPNLLDITPNNPEALEEEVASDAPMWSSD